jgi:hypothetical protein
MIKVYLHTNFEDSRSMNFDLIACFMFCYYRSQQPLTFDLKIDVAASPHQGTSTYNFSRSMHFHLTLSDFNIKGCMIIMLFISINMT